MGYAMLAVPKRGERIRMLDGTTGVVVHSAEYFIPLDTRWAVLAERRWERPSAGIEGIEVKPTNISGEWQQVERL